MSFIFGRGKKNQATGGLPNATREISSSHGPDTRTPATNAVAGVRDGIERRGTVGQQPSTAIGPLASFEKGVTSPEPSVMRPRAESDVNATRNNTVMRLPNQSVAPPADSPYPWSQRRLDFTAGVSPFPRYGAALNATASKEGWIYLMGGLINSTKVKGDLWMIEAANGRMSCFPIATDNGPSPRVGHASLLVGNAFIVFGGDTKLEDGDLLDDTLYLLNTSTKQWSRASPAGPRPAGRYGHTLNILGSKIYIFGGQVEGFFFNDLIAFDLNTLQSPGNRWEIMIPNNGGDQNLVLNEDGEPNLVLPPARTNHSMVTWQDKLYLFGGTDGTRWFNDVWTYDPRTNTWTELDCIGYIPAPREGHAAALVNDTMYVFGGRVQDGSDLGDLAAFRISTRRWYMFQNMGVSPSPRSGHGMTAYGKHIIVLGGEPSSAPRDINELSWTYLLDTSKIRYPPTEQTAQGQIQGQLPLRQITNGPVAAQQGPQASRSPPLSGPILPGSHPPRGASAQAQTSTQGSENIADGNTATRGLNHAGKLSLDAARPSQREIGDVGNMSGGPVQAAPAASAGSILRSGSLQTAPKTGTRTTRAQESIDSAMNSTPRMSVDDHKREILAQRPIDSGVGSSPALTQHNEELLRELEAARQRNAWYAAELAVARKSGYQPNPSGSPLLDQQASETFADDDKPLIEALLRMRTELGRIQGSMDQQAQAFASKVAEVEKQRDAAVSEAAYAKAKLAAHGGSSHAGTPIPDSGVRSPSSPDLERIDDTNRRLALALKQQTEFSMRVEGLSAELGNERKARTLAEDTAEAAQKRLAELESYKQRNAFEVESLRAQLHEAEAAVREIADRHSTVETSSRLMEVDKNDLEERHARLSEEHQSHIAILTSLRSTVSSSTEKAALLEAKLAEEREIRASTEQQLAQLRSQHEQRSSELESANRQLRDAQESADRHAAEAKTHREAVLLGLNNIGSRSASSATIRDERATVLQEQLEAANLLARKHKEAADTAAERLRSAEERIAGLETYQEQSSRDSLTVRKQLQAATRDAQSAQIEKNDMQSQLERYALESNALQVQLSTLKTLLEERGISHTADARRSRALESPAGSISRYGTPEMGRVRELERQLDDAVKTHEEMRTQFEQRESEVSREWEQKLADLDSDHQGAMKYVRGLEKMLAKMKQELQRVKGNNAELEKEVQQHKSVAAAKSEAPADWEKQRENLQNEIEDMQQHVKVSVGHLEAQVESLQASLSEAEAQRNQLQKSQQDHQAALTAATQRSKADLDSLRRENTILDQRARDAERKVQLFLDQFETSVDNYRRMSRQADNAPHNTTNGAQIGSSASHDTSRSVAVNGLNVSSTSTASSSTAHPNHPINHRRQVSSIAGDSIYSTSETDLDLDELTLPDDSLISSEDDHTDTGSGRATPNAHSFPTAGLAGSIGHAHSSAVKKAPSATMNGVMASNTSHERDRSSMALDGLASELEALRSQWQTTRQGGDKYDDSRAKGTISHSSNNSSTIAPLSLGKGFGAGTGLGLGFGERKGSATDMNGSNPAIKAAQVAAANGEDR